MKTISMNRLHDLFPIRDKAGDIVLVVALGIEKQSEVSRRINSAGGSANVIVVSDDDTISKLTVKNINVHEVNAVVDHVDVHEDITMDMFITYLKQNPGRPVHVVSNGDSVRGTLEDSSQLVAA